MLASEDAWDICGRLARLQSNLADHTVAFVSARSTRLVARRFVGHGGKKEQIFALVGGRPQDAAYAGLVACAIKPQEQPICGLCGEDFTEDYLAEREDDYFEPPGGWYSDFVASQVRVFPECSQLLLTEHACNLFVAGICNKEVDGFFCECCMAQFKDPDSQMRRSPDSGCTLFRYMSSIADKEGYVNWQVTCSQPVHVHAERSQSSAVLGKKAPGQRFRAWLNRRNRDWVTLLDEPGFILRKAWHPELPFPGLDLRSSRADLDEWHSLVKQATLLERVREVERNPATWSLAHSTADAAASSSTVSDA